MTLPFLHAHYPQTEHLMRFRTYNMLHSPTSRRTYSGGCFAYFMLPLVIHAQTSIIENDKSYPSARTVNAHETYLFCRR